MHASILVEMPDDSIRPVVNDEFGDTAVLVLAIHQVSVRGRSYVREEDRYSFRQLEEFADDVRDAIRLLPGIAKVDKFGVQEEAIYIETDLGNWSQLNLTTRQLESLANTRNIIEPGGQLDTAAGRYAVKPEGEFNAIDEIQQIASVVRSGDGENSVYLSDLGLTVSRAYRDPPSIICRYGDTDYSVPAVTLGVTMKSGSNIIDICQRSMERVHQLLEVDQQLPPDVVVTPVSNQSKNVSERINAVITNVWQAVVIVVAVVFIVLGFRTSFVMAANIPIVVVASLGLISVMGVQLEQISLAALIISLGLLVDNAVQVCDQARTNQLAGMKPMKAAIEGANTLAIPMLVGTLTTMAAFIPMLIALEGGGREYVYSLPVTVSTTLALSWILAMTFCVILAGWFIRVPQTDRPSSPILLITDRLRRLFVRKKKPVSPAASSDNLAYAIYDQIGSFAVRFKWLTMLISLAVFFTILQLPVSSEFFPQAERDQFAVQIFLPETATIRQTDEIAKQVEDVIRRLSPTTDESGNEVQRLRSLRTLVGGGGSRWHLAWDPKEPSRNYSEILVRTTSGKFTSEYADQLRHVCEKGDASLGIDPIVGARVVPVELALGPPADPLVFRITGNGYADRTQLRSLANRMKRIVSDQPEAWNVNDSWGVDGYQVQVNVDKDRATLAGVTNSQVAKTLNSYYSGLQLTTFREGDHQVPVYFRLTPEERTSIRGLQEAFVEGDNGKVPLSSIADFHFSWEPAKVERRDQNRVVTVSSRLARGVTGNDIVNRVLQSDAMKQLQSELPSGYSIEPGGSYEESADAGLQMLTSFGISLMLIVLCLIFQYNAWSKPVVILATLPLALVGAWMGLYLTNNSLGFMPQLGILALFGIVLNTAIIFIEFADILISERSSKSDGRGPDSWLDQRRISSLLVGCWQATDAAHLSHDRHHGGRLDSTGTQWRPPVGRIGMVHDRWLVICYRSHLARCPRLLRHSRRVIWRQADHRPNRHGWVVITWHRLLACDFINLHQ